MNNRLRGLRASYRQGLTALGLVLALGWSGGIESARATTLAYEDFGALVRKADGIVLGKVQDVQSFLGEDNAIYTLVTLDAVRVVRGQYAKKTLVLRFKGGELDGRRLVLEGSPEMAVGEEVLAFVQGNGTQWVPLVGWEQGLFRVTDAGNIVTDANGNRVFGVDHEKVIKERRFAAAAQVLGAEGAEIESHGGGAGVGNGVGDGDGSVLRRRSTASAGVSDDGSPSITAEETVVEQPKGSPLSVEAFVTLIQQRADQLADDERQQPRPLESVAGGAMVGTGEALDAPANGDEASSTAPSSAPGKPHLPKRTPVGAPPADE